MDTFQGKSEGLEPQLASKDLQASKPIISSSSSLSERRYKSGTFLFSNSRSYLNHMCFVLLRISKSIRITWLCMADLLELLV